MAQRPCGSAALLNTGGLGRGGRAGCLRIMAGAPSALGLGTARASGEGQGIAAFGGLLLGGGCKQKVSRIPAVRPGVSHGASAGASERLSVAMQPESRRSPPATRCAAAGEAAEPAPQRRTTPVVEHVMLFKMPIELPLQAEQDFLDHLYTLQYYYPHILSISLGRVFSKVSDGYTHGVVVRLPSTAALQQFLAHPALNEVLEKFVEPFSKGSLSLSFAAQVEQDVEALFKRGDDYESGVEHLVFVKAKGTADPEQQEAMLHAVSALPEKVGPAIVQLTVGTVVPGEGEGAGAEFTHGLIVRVASEEDLATYNRHPAHREVIRKNLLPMAERILSVDFSVDPVGNKESV